MTPSEDQASPQGFPDLSSADIVKLQTATFLSLCTALNGAGVVRLADMATILSAHVGEADRDPWAHIVRAIAVVLTRDKDAAREEDRGAHPKSRAFSVVQGGVQ